MALRFFKGIILNAEPIPESAIRAVHVSQSGATISTDYGLREAGGNDFEALRNLIDNGDLIVTVIDVNQTEIVAPIEAALDEITFNGSSPTQVSHTQAKGRQKRK